MKTAAQVSLRDSEPVRISFSGFTGEGLAATPLPGQLDSDTWLISGLTSGGTRFGDIQARGAYARGEASGGVLNGGLYAFEVAGGDTALGLQPTEGELTPGFITLKVANETGKRLDQVAISYELYHFNDQDRGSSVAFSYSGDNIDYRKLPRLNHVSPGRADLQPIWNKESRSVTLSNLNLPAGEFLYLRWTIDDSTGSGTDRDELALDNVTIRTLEGSGRHRVDRGDLVITEIKPVSETTRPGTEYIEIYNRTNHPIDLHGLTLEDGMGENHNISRTIGQTIVQPYRFFVMARNGDPKINGDLPVDYVFGDDLDLDELEGETLIIRDGTHLLAQATFGRSPGEIPLELSDVSQGHDGKTVEDDYQLVSVNDTYGSGERGSPGARGSELRQTYGVKLERQAGWHLLSPPVEGARPDMIERQLPLDQEEQQNLRFYTGYNGKGFTSFGNRTETFRSGNGILFYLPAQSPGSAANGTATLDLTGSEPQQDVSVELHREGDGWNLVGNPYGSPLDVQGITTRNGSLASTVAQVWDDSAGTFRLATSLDNKVQPWAGFFIQNRDAGQLVIPEAAKLNDNESPREPSLQDEKRQLSFELTGDAASDDRNVADRATILYFTEDAKHGWDRWDAEELLPLPKNPDEPYYGAYLYFTGIHNGRRVAKAQDSRPYTLEDRTQYNMELKSPGFSGTFELRWKKEQIPDTWQMTLIDERNGTEIDLLEQESYRFTVNAGSEEDLTAYTGITAPSENPDRRFRLMIQKESEQPEQPEADTEKVKLNPNYPNPFNPSTTISFELTEPAQVTVSIHTVIGQKVTTLVDETRDAGVYEETWNASDMPSGVYLLILEVGGQIFSRRMTLIK